VNELLQYRDLWLIGAGGKTTLMYRLAAAWRALGETVVCTSTTRILPPEPGQCPDLRIHSLPSLMADLRQRPSPLVTVASRMQDGKCIGFSADEALSLKSAAQHVVIEADGSAGRPLKAHASYEPVVAPQASCVVAVVGAWCVGAPLDAEHVHRPERVSGLTGRPIGSILTADDVANVIMDEEGWLGTVPPRAAFHVVVAGGDAGIFQALRCHPQASRLAGILQG
jgi:probable selenium-dependent hydroxylase accessory protein YqeC